jgi:Xaa-Pro aminopeptidase
MRVAAEANEVGAAAVFAAAKVGMSEQEMAVAYYDAIDRANALRHHLCINCVAGAQDFLMANRRTPGFRPVT